MFKRFFIALGSIFVMSSAAFSGAQAADSNTVNLELSTGGTVVIELAPDLAPKHVDQIKKLISEGFYDGIIFHRVISGFMAQTGDPTGTGMGGSKYPNIPAEFTQTEYKRGTLGMARSNAPDSANSQFFICFTDTGCSFLKGQYTVVGQVTSGMEFVDKIAVGEPPASPDKIVKMTLASGAAPAADAASAPGTELTETTPAAEGAAAQ
jgi:peptidylprolyl isomerase